MQYVALKQHDTDKTVTLFKTTDLLSVGETTASFSQLVFGLYSTSFPPPTLIIFNRKICIRYSPAYKVNLQIYTSILMHAIILNRKIKYYSAELPKDKSSKM